MQPLALIGIDEPLRSEVASRLHSATICSVADASLVAVLGPLSDEELFHGAISGQTWLLTVEHCRSQSAFLDLLAGVCRKQISFTLANPERFRPSRQLVRQQVESGKLGQPVLARSHRWLASTSHDFCTNELPIAFVQDLDVTMWLMGSRPKTVFAISTDTHSPGPCGLEDSLRIGNPPTHEGSGYEASDNIGSGNGGGAATCVVHCGFVNEGMAQWDFSLRPSSAELYESLTILGSLGAAYSDDHTNRQLRFRGDRAEAFGSDEGCRALANLLQQFIDDSLAKTDLATSIQDWCDALKLSELIRKSLDTRQAVGWEDC